MLWYLLKTWAGREEELVSEVHRSVPASIYKECFVIYQERLWRKQQRNIVHVEVLLPGCVFLTCKSHELCGLVERHGSSVSVRCQIERIPAISRLIASGSLTIQRMMEEDAEFLEKISGNQHMVKLSYVVKDEEGNIRKLSEPLNTFHGQIERMQFKKRYAMVRHRLWGEERRFVLGFMLKEDVNQTILLEPAEDTLAEQVFVKDNLVEKADLLEKETMRKRGSLPKNENPIKKKNLPDKEKYMRILAEEMA